MSRRLKALSLFAVGVWAVTAVATAQPPGESKSVFGPTKTVSSAKMVPQSPAKKADAPDTAIEAALANDPDVRMARAKIELAQAEHAKARHAVTLKVMTLRADIAQQKKALAGAEEMFKHVEKAYLVGNIPSRELLAAREKLEVGQSALARSETELKLITGDDGKAARTTRTTAAEAFAVALDLANVDLAYSVRLTKTTSGPIAERIRAALDKTVKLGEKNEKVTFDKALEAFKKVGLDVPVRVPLKMSPIFTLGEELPVGAWLQMFADETPDCLMLVREYGLLVPGKTLNPPTDAVSVFDLWKQKPAAAGAEKK